MSFTESLVRAFQETYEQKFGQSISATEAKLELAYLAELVRVAMRKEFENEK